MSSQTPGILNRSTQDVLVLADDKITIRNNVKVYGTLEVGLIRATEVIADQRYEKQYLEFSSDSGVVGSGLLWVNENSNKQFVLRNNPDRFWSTESIDMPRNQSYMIDGYPVLTSSYLGNTVTHSNIQHLGNLKQLTVFGPVNLSDSIFFNPTSERLGIGIEEANGRVSVYDNTYDVEIVIDTNKDGFGKFGTYNTKGLAIVTDNQSRISVDPQGNITIGHEYKDNNTTRIFGKLGVGVNNPKENLEVAGNIKWSNKLFATGNTPPTTGAYTKGDIIWNNEPKSNSYIGWVCTATGNPGLWRPFGLIQP
jgi:hypothetical protein